MRLSVPALTVVDPPKVLVPVRFKIPHPAFVRPTVPPASVPVRFSVAPPSIPIVASADIVTLPAALLTPDMNRSAPSDRLPLPAMERFRVPNAVVPCRTSPPPLATVIRVLVPPRALVPGTLNTPALTVVAPV